MEYLKKDLHLNGVLYCSNIRKDKSVYTLVSKQLSCTEHLVAADNRVSRRRFNKCSAIYQKNMKHKKTKNRSSLKSDGAV